MVNYEKQFQNLTDSEIHELNRNIQNSAELEFSINNRFLNQILYDDEKIIENIRKEAEYYNIFSIMTLANWYREGSFYEQSDKKYVECLQSIVHIKTERLDAQKLIKSLNKKINHHNSNDLLYGGILGEAYVQLGQYYSSSTDRNNLKIAKEFFEKSKFYAPSLILAIPLLSPVLGLSIKTLGLIVAKSTFGIGASGLIGAGAAVAVPVALPVAAAFGAIAGVARHLAHKNKNEKTRQLYKSTIPFTKKNTSLLLEKKEQQNISCISPDVIAKQDFGELWNNLTDVSQKSISTAYKNYYQNKDDKDYDFSSVIGLLGKALEGELKIRFYNEYIEYLKRHFASVQDFIEYNKLNNYQINTLTRVLLYAPKTDNREFQFFDYVNHGTFTLGSFRFLLGIDKQGTISPSSKFFCHPSMLDYVKTTLYKDIFNKKSDKEIDTFLKELSDNIVTLINYRNKADHAGENLSVDDANLVLYIMITTKKILLRILDPLVPYSD